MSSEKDGGDLDPRIQIELENLNSATDEINKLEIELEEANSTFRILLNESTRRLKLLSKKLGNCIEKARPYYDALEKARTAQIECQKAAVQFQRAHEIHAAAKETVALAEQRFMSNSHEWQFDNAWQEMLNHATQKVTDAEIKKAESHAEHQRRAQIFNAAELKLQELEDRFRRNIQKSRPYFEEKQICQDQLLTQKNRIHELQAQVAVAKSTYSTALRNLEKISDDIHKQRGDILVSGSPNSLNGLVVPQQPPPGPREPGVGAELSLDFNFELEKCDHPSIGGSELSLTLPSNNSSLSASVSEHNLYNDLENDEIDETLNSHLFQDEEEDLEQLRQKVKTLAVRPVEGGDGSPQQDNWENELNETVDKLDHLMMMKECAAAASITNNNQNRISFNYDSKSNIKKSQETQTPTKLTPNALYLFKKSNHSEDLKNINSSIDNVISLPGTPVKLLAIKKLKKLEPLPSVNVSMRELPLLAGLSTEIFDKGVGYTKQRRRSLE